VIALLVSLKQAKIGVKRGTKPSLFIQKIQQKQQSFSTTQQCLKEKDFFNFVIIVKV